MAQSRTQERPALRGELAAHAAELLRRFGAGQAAARTFFAPGRVNLLGAHLDYNRGPVLPMAVDRGTFVAMRPRRDARVRLASTVQSGEVTIDLGGPLSERTETWVDYPVGVLRELMRAGRMGCGLDVLFGGNLPIGAGLSSSASICVGTAYALDRMWNLGMSAAERVSLALESERGFVGVQCGIMDPFAVGLARANSLLWLDCKDESYEHVPFPSERIAIAVADSGVRRELARGEFNQRVTECRRALEGLSPHAPSATCLRDVSMDQFEVGKFGLTEVLRRRAQHVIEEVERTFEAKRMLERGDLLAFGAQLTRCHRSLRDLYEVSTPELDLLVEAAGREESVLGSRLTGAGFGGCTVILLRRSEGPLGHAAALERIADAFSARFGRRPATWVFGPDSGPREIEVEGVAGGPAAGFPSAYLAPN